MLLDMIEISMTDASSMFKSFSSSCVDVFVYHTRCCWTVGFHGNSLQQRLKRGHVKRSGGGNK